MQMQSLESEVKKMYYLLNYTPFILYIIASIMHVEIDFGVFAIIYLFAQPLYLLIINVPFIYKKSISYVGSIICMLSVIVFNVLYAMLINKIQTGYFIGDVPRAIYYLMLGVPAVIVLVGIVITYLIKK